MSETWTSRATILRCVEAVPGAHLRCLERMAQLPLGTLRHHLGVLVEHGAVVFETDRRFKRFYPASMTPETRRLWDAMRSRTTRAIVQQLVEAGPARQSALGMRLGLGESSAHRYIARLRALGVLCDEQGWLSLRHPQQAAALMLSVDPTRLDRLVDGAEGLFDLLDA